MASLPKKACNFACENLETPDMKRIFLLLAILFCAGATVPSFAQTDKIPYNPDALNSNEYPTQICDSLSDSTIVQSLPLPERFRIRMDSLIENTEMCKVSQAGILFYDITDDTILYDYGSRQVMRPASVMKTMTAITALDRLGVNYEYKTRLYCKGEIKDSVLLGDLYIVAGYDPRFDSDDMQAFVKAIEAEGIRAIGGNIYADVSIKDTLSLGRGWIWHWKYDEIPTLPLLYNSKPCFMEKFMEALDADSIAHPFSYACTELPKDSIKLLSTRTHTIDEILLQMLKDSDNQYAESLFWQLAALDGKAYPSYEHGAKYVEDHIRRNLHLNPHDYTIADGSGLSVYDCLSPQLIVENLLFAWRNPKIYNHFYPCLPVGGEDGTLAKRMKNEYTIGNIHAKTGSVARVITLAGYCRTYEGHDIVFALMHNGISSDNRTRNWDDEALRLLTAP